ncbi:MAG: FAD-binding protein [Candidatus Odinarchaeota archaeon]
MIVFVKDTKRKDAELDPDRVFTWEVEDQADILLNVFDKHAIEAALKIKEKTGTGKVTAISLCSETGEKILHEAIAMGCDEAIRIDITSVQTIDFCKVAKVLARATEKIEHDLVLFGMQGYDLGTATIPPIVSEFLGLPYAYGVEKIDVYERNFVIVRKVVEGGYRAVKLSIPAALSISPSGAYEEPRYTSIRKIKEASQKELVTWTLEDLGIAPEELKTTVAIGEVIKLEEKAECVVFKEKTVTEMVDRLMIKLKARMSRELAKEIIKKSMDLKTLVLIEITDKKISNRTKEVIHAAGCCCEAVEGIIIGQGASDIASEGIKYGLSKVYVADDPALAGQNILYHVRTIQNLIEEISPDVIMAAATIYGQELMPRLAARFNQPFLPGVQTIEFEGKRVSGKRPFFEEKLLAVVKATADPMIFVTIDPGYNIEAKRDDTMTGKIEDYPPVILEQDNVEEFIEESISSDTVNITSAKVIISGGIGVGSKEHFDIIFKAAEELGGVVGASRAAVKSGWLADDHKIGLTGKIVTPDLYIAVGISGSIKHQLGMRKSKTIIAINTDKEAPILDVADFAIIGDLHKVLPVLVEKLKPLMVENG